MISLDDDGMGLDMLGELLSFGTGYFCLAPSFLLDDQGIDDAILVLLVTICVFHRS